MKVVFDKDSLYKLLGIFFFIIGMGLTCHTIDNFDNVAKKPYKIEMLKDSTIINDDGSVSSYKLIKVGDDIYKVDNDFFKYIIREGFEEGRTVIKECCRIDFDVKKQDKMLLLSLFNMTAYSLSGLFNGIANQDMDEINLQTIQIVISTIGIFFFGVFFFFCL